VVSDDASSDGTVEVLRGEISAYRGRHRIILNVNDSNLGIFRNFEKAVRLSSGSIIIACAGDDISYAHRVSTLLRLFGEGKNIYAAHSSVQVLTCDGVGRGVSNRQYENELIESVRKRRYILGASAAYRRELFYLFPPLYEGLMNEDVVLPARALMLGGKVGFVSRPLVGYRVHDSQWKGGGSKFSRAKRKNGVLRALAYRQMLIDFRSEVNKIKSPILERCIINNIEEDEFFVIIIQLRVFSMVKRMMRLMYFIQYAKAVRRAVGLCFSSRAAGG
jgi:glycosyltransferase involved in cell wall biosynthesis